MAAALPGAKVALGLKLGVTIEQLAAAIQNETAEDMLHWVAVHAGEMIYVSPGTVHTMTAGSILLETQQQSDITYRLYDYGRPRPLHLEHGLEAVRIKTGAGKVVAREKSKGSTGVRSELVSAPFFAVDRFELIGGQSFKTEHCGKSAVQILTAFEGSGTVEAEGCEPVRFTRGDAVVVPANLGAFQVVPEGKLEMLRAMVPHGILAEPKTYL